MGQRGPLKLVSSTTRVEDALAGTVQLDVPDEARSLYKPARVKESESLSVLWDELVPHLEQSHLLTALDVPALEMCLRHFRAATTLDEAWHNEDYEASVTDHSDKGSSTKKNPAEVALRSQSAMFLEYAKQLGLTFQARARTPSTNQGTEDETNPFRSAIEA